MLIEGKPAPNFNLDSTTGESIVELLLELARERKKSVLIVTHDTGLASRGDRALHIKDGRLDEETGLFVA